VTPVRDLIWRESTSGPGPPPLRFLILNFFFQEALLPHHASCISARLIAFMGNGSLACGREKYNKRELSGIRRTKQTRYS
jgi:hypothetical protein